MIKCPKCPKQFDEKKGFWRKFKSSEKEIFTHPEYQKHLIKFHIKRTVGRGNPLH